MPGIARHARRNDDSRSTTAPGPEFLAKVTALLHQFERVLSPDQLPSANQEGQRIARRMKIVVTYVEPALHHFVDVYRGSWLIKPFIERALARRLYGLPLQCKVTSDGATV